jgi:hypothetical protein
MMLEWSCGMVKMRVGEVEGCCGTCFALAVKVNSTASEHRYRPGSQSRVATNRIKKLGCVSNNPPYLY